MSEPLFITQTTVPFPIVQGTYRWLLANSEPQADHEENAGWAFEVLPQVAQQYELFSPYVPHQALFQGLVEQWRIERGTRSSTTEIVLCPSYQAIIGMGAAAVPLIFSQMEAEADHPDQWFWALQALTNADPVNEEDEGNFLKMAQSWLQWARQRYVW